MEICGLGLGWKRCEQQYEQHWLADSIFPAKFTVKMLFVFQTFFTEKHGEILKAFSPLFNFLSSFSPQTGQVVKMFWVFHLVSS
jgi:hypothetical protein